MEDEKKDTAKPDEENDSDTVKPDVKEDPDAALKKMVDAYIASQNPESEQDVNSESEEEYDKKRGPAYYETRSQPSSWDGNLSSDRGEDGYYSESDYNSSDEGGRGAGDDGEDDW